MKTKDLCNNRYSMIKLGRSQWVRFNIFYRYKLLKHLSFLVFSPLSIVMDLPYWWIHEFQAGGGEGGMVPLGVWGLF